MTNSEKFLEYKAKVNQMSQISNLLKIVILGGTSFRVDNRCGECQLPRCPFENDFFNRIPRHQANYTHRPTEASILLGKYEAETSRIHVGPDEA